MNNLILNNIPIEINDKNIIILDYFDDIDKEEYNSIYSYLEKEGFIKIGTKVKLKKCNFANKYGKKKD